LLSAISAAGSGLLSVATAATGLHLLAGLPDACDDQTLVAAARQRQIGAAPLSGFFVAPPETKRQGLLMGFGNTRPEAMPGAVQTLCSLIEDSTR
jgi:GntR family transcriptional regulator/MocR family aminotransferase